MSTPAAFDDFGRAVISLSFDRMGLQLFSGQTVIADVVVDMVVADRPNPMQRYVFDVAVDVGDKQGAQVALTISPPGQASPGQRPIFTATLASLAVSRASSREARSRPEGARRLVADLPLPLAPLHAANASGHDEVHAGPGEGRRKTTGAL